MAKSRGTRLVIALRFPKKKLSGSCDGTSKAFRMSGKCKKEHCRVWIEIVFALILNNDTQLSEVETRWALIMQECPLDLEIG